MGGSPASIMTLAGRTIRAFLLDVTGVLYDGKSSIEGSIEALERIRHANYKVLLCSNETQCTRADLVEKLGAAGFNVTEDDIFSPAPVCVQYLQEHDLRPFLLVHPSSRKDYCGLDCSQPNAVVLGDAAEEFTYENLNKAFSILINADNSVLISLGMGRYYEDGGQLHLDVGPYAKALEFATSSEAVVIGKPSSKFFEGALRKLNVSAEETVMIGDDVVSDVGGAQACGIAGILVRSGKYRPCDEQHPDVKPDLVVDNLLKAIETILTD